MRTITLTGPGMPDKVFSATGDGWWELTLMTRGGPTYGGTWRPEQVVDAAREHVS